MVLAVVAVVVLLAVVVNASQRDPYVRASLDLSGNEDHGSKLFLINCAGCHGIAGQGVVGPNLHGVSQRKNDPALIQQVVSGQTPPMPSFQAPLPVPTPAPVVEEEEIDPLDAFMSGIDDQAQKEKAAASAKEVTPCLCPLAFPRS